MRLNQWHFKCCSPASHSHSQWCNVQGVCLSALMKSRERDRSRVTVFRPFLKNLVSLLDSWEIMDCHAITVCGDFNVLSSANKTIVELCESRGCTQVTTAPPPRRTLCWTWFHFPATSPWKPTIVTPPCTLHVVMVHDDLWMLHHSIMFTFLESICLKCGLSNDVSIRLRLQAI